MSSPLDDLQVVEDKNYTTKSPLDDLQAVEDKNYTALSSLDGLVAKDDTIVDKIKNQLSTTAGNVANTLSDYATGVGKAIDTYTNERDASYANAAQASLNGADLSENDPTQGYETPGMAQAGKNVYNEAVGKPAGYLAITPFVPAPVRVVAGVLAAPMVLDSTLQSYDKNVENNDGTPVVSTAEQTLLDPVVKPIQELYNDPGKFGQELLDNPLNTWDKVFLPGAMIHGAAKGIEAATPDLIKAPIKAGADRVANRFGEALDAYDPVSGLDGLVKDQPERAADDTTSNLNSLVQDQTEPAPETGNMRADVYNHFRNKGYSDAEASALTANAEAESGFDPNADSTKSGTDGNQSKGLWQFTGDRETALKQFAADQGRDWTDWRTQADFVDWELHNTESGALDAMRKNPNATPEEMADIVQWKYERPAEDDTSGPARQKAAREIFDGNYGDASRQPSNVYSGKEQYRTADEPFQSRGISFDDQGKPTNLNLSDEQTGNNELLSDENNNPKTFYHGTNSEFDNFNSDKTGGLINFTDKEDVAQSYANGAGGGRDALNDNSKFIVDYDGNAYEKTPSGDWEAIGYSKNDKYSDIQRGKTVQGVTLGEKIPNNEIDKIGSMDSDYTVLPKKSFIKQVNLKMNNPLDLVENPQKGLEVFRKIQSDLTKDGNPNRTVARAIDSLEQNDGNNFWTTTKYEPFYKDYQKVIVPKLKEMGYDGLIFHDDSHKTYAVFDKDQVKDKFHAKSTEYTDDGRKVDIPDDGKSYMSAAKDSDIPVGENANIPAMDKPVSRKQIMQTVEDLFDTHIKTGRIGNKNSNGWYNPRSDVIRTRNFAEVRTSMHELGHYTDERFGFSDMPGFDREFVRVIHNRFGSAYDKLGIEGIRKEGVAEFFHDYVTNNSKAKASFPAFYDEFKKRLAQDKELQGKVNKMATVAHQWYRQEPFERVKGTVSFSDNKPFAATREFLKNPIDKLSETLHKVYTQAVDELHPLKQLTKEVENITGAKISFKDSPFMQAWAARGWVGKAQSLIEHGDPKNKIPSFKEIISGIPKGQYENFVTYLTALRNLDIEKWNRVAERSGQKTIKTSSDFKDSIATTRWGGQQKGFYETQRKLVDFQNNLLDKLVDAGMISRKAVHAMQEKFPNYVPFMREFTEESAGQFLSGKGFVNVKDPINKMKGSSRDIVDPMESIIKNVYMFTNLIERNHVGQAVAKLAKLDGIGKLIEQVSGTARAADSTFSVWENGKKITYATTPDVLQALKMMDAESSNVLVKILSYPAGWLRAGATLSPEFILRNPVRDMISATIFSKHGFIPVVDTFKGVALYLKKGDVYWDYMNSGAAHAAMVGLDRDYMGGQIRTLLKEPGVAKMVTTNPVEVLRALSEATEVATRLAEFDNARKGYTGTLNRLLSDKRNPMSDQEAGVASRDVTLDFSRIGSKTKNMNKITAFFNASIQGVDKMARAFKENPADMTFKTFTAVTVPSVLLWYLNKDDQRYQELPQWQKDIFWIIPTKDALIKIPKPFEVGVAFGTGMERMLQYMDDKEKGRNGVGFKGFGKSLYDALAPSLWPSAAIPIIEDITNYSMFLGRNVIPQSQKDLPAYLQYGPNTSSVGRAVGKAAGVSPYVVDNTIRGYGGGLATLGLDLADRATGISDTRPAKRFTEQPVIRGFTTTPYTSSESVQRVYDDFSDQQALFNEFKLTGKRPDGFNPKSYGMLKNATEALSQTNKAQKAIRDSDKLDSETKRDRLDALKMTQVNIARRGLGLDKINK